MRTYRVLMTEHIYHEWTIEAHSKAEALEEALNGCPDDTCQGESDEPEIKLEAKP